MEKIKVIIKIESNKQNDLYTVLVNEKVVVIAHSLFVAEGHVAILQRAFEALRAEVVTVIIDE